MNMTRRDFVKRGLTAIGAGLCIISLSGCVGNDEGNKEKYGTEGCKENITGRVIKVEYGISDKDTKQYPGSKGVNDKLTFANGRSLYVDNAEAFTFQTGKLQEISMNSNCAPYSKDIFDGKIYYNPEYAPIIEAVRVID